MSAEGIFLMVCAIIAGLLISSLITYWCRTLFKHVRDKGYIGRNQDDTYYVTTFFLMYLPILNVIYLLGLLIIYEISNLERL